MTPLDRPALASQLAPIRARADAATPGPWTTQNHETWVSASGEPFFSMRSVIARTHFSENAEFIAAARTDVPALLAIIDRLTDALDVADKTRDLIRDLTDADECWFDHHGGCQAHGYLSLKPGELCPHAEAKKWVADYDAAKEALK